MNAIWKTTSLLVIVTIGTSVWADTHSKKAITQIDFNKMIAENNQTRHQLKKQIDSASADSADKTANVDSDRAKVIDFVDVEVGWGEAPPVVDRRFDRSTSPRVINVN